MSTQNWPQDPNPRTTTAGAAPGAAGGSSTSDAAKGEAREVGKEGAAAGQHVADVAKGEAQDVAQEAKDQAKNLTHELSDDLKSQAGTQQKRVAEGLRSISDEFKSMADKSEESGTATQWVQEAGRRAGDVAGWLEQRDPGSVLDETRRFARNRPGAFLAIAAGAGLLAGRLARGLQSGNDGGSATSGRRSAQVPQTYGSTHTTAAYPPGTVGGAATVGGATGTAGTSAAGAGDQTAGINPPPPAGPQASDPSLPSMASTQAPGYAPGFPDAQPGRPTNPTSPDDDARGLDQGRGKR